MISVTPASGQHPREACGETSAYTISQPSQTKNRKPDMLNDTLPADINALPAGDGSGRGTHCGVPLTGYYNCVAGFRATRSL